MFHGLKKWAILLAAPLCLGVTGSPSAHAAQELNFTSVMMTTHPVMANAIMPMWDELKARTNGELTITSYNAGTLVPDAELYTSTQRGIVDAVIFFPPRTPHLFPLLILNDGPFLFTSSRAASFSIYTLVANNAQLQKELGDVRVLAMTTSTPKDLVSIKPIRTLEDMRGKRVGVLDAMSSDVIALLGGTAITLPLADMYMGLQRGMLDAVLAPIPTYRSTKVCEVGKYITRCSISVSTSPCVMNKQVYDKFAPAVRAEVDKIAGLPFTALMSNWVDRSTQADLEYLQQHDKVQVIELAPEERARWAAKAEPMFEQWKANARKAGVQDPDAILKELRGYAEYFNNEENQKNETAKYQDVLGKLYMQFSASK